MFVETESDRLSWLVDHELSAAQRALAPTLKDYHLRWAARFALNRDEAVMLTTVHDETVRQALTGGGDGGPKLLPAGKIEAKLQKRRQRSVTSAVALRRYFTALAFIVLELAVGALAEQPPPIPPGTEVWAAMSGDAYRA